MAWWDDFDIEDLFPIFGGLLAGSSGGNEPAGQTTTTEEPWGPQQKYLKDLFKNAQKTSKYGGKMTEDQNLAMGEMGKWASGENYNPLLGVDNPYLQKVIDAQSGDVMRNLMPMMNKANAASGSFGNSGVAEMYGRQAADSLGDLANQTRFQDYTNQQNLYESDAQRRIGATTNFANMAQYEQNLPWQNLKNYGQAITGNYGGTQSNPYFTNTAANVIGGIGAGTAIAKQWKKDDGDETSTTSTWKT